MSAWFSASTWKCGGILRNSSRLGSTTSAVTDKCIFSFNESEAIGAEEKPLLCVRVPAWVTESERRLRDNSPSCVIHGSVFKPKSFVKIFMTSFAQSLYKSF